MKIKYQEKGYGNMSGASLLRQIQNEHTPVLDLFIRESIQNSLDAVLPDSKKVQVDLTAGVFETEKLSPFFEGIDVQMNRLFPGEQQFLAVRDTGTCGLTGPLSLADVHGSKYGNLQKLIYQIAKSQENQGAGGSWGIGKTVYFRVGEGLVIYYSRILDKATNSYEERLAACLVENEESPVLLLENEHHTGIAWWGVPDKKLKGKDGTVPLTVKAEIHRILEVFGIRPMTGSTTGTQIIIPFTNADTLLRQTETAMESSRESRIPYWKTDLSDYLKVGVQKWYCPRLDNQLYRGAFLSCSVNGEAVLKKDFLPFFGLIQTLYNNPVRPQTFQKRKVESEKIKLQNEFDRNRGTTEAGTLSFLNVTQQDLDMCPPENLPSPYTDIDQDEAELMHEPILAYVRKPGMIVSYETNSDWTRTMPKTEDNEFIVGVFRSSQEAVLAEKYRNDKIKTLEDYLRKSENADHMSWRDINLGSQKPPIIQKIRRNVQNKISNRYKEDKTKQPKERNLGLGRLLGARLLPPEGSNYWDNRVGGSDGPGGLGGGARTGGSAAGQGGVSAGFSMNVIGTPEYLVGEVRVPVMLSFGSALKGELTVFVKTETGKASYEYWKKTFGTTYPARLNGLEILNIHTGKQKPRKLMSAVKGFGRKRSSYLRDSGKYEGLTFRFKKDGRPAQCTSIVIERPKTDKCWIEAVICYSVDNVEGILDFHKIKADGKAEEDDQ